MLPMHNISGREEHRKQGFEGLGLGGECIFIRFRIKSDEKLAAAEVEDRPLDRGRLIEHQLDRLAGIEASLVLVRQLAEGGAGAVEQGFPANLLLPPLKQFPIDSCRLVIVEIVVDAALVEPSSSCRSS